MQGKYDPLNDAVARANSLKAVCPQIDLQFVEAGNVAVRCHFSPSTFRWKFLSDYSLSMFHACIAGHCPHDELPETVVDILDSWAKLKVSVSSPLMKDVQTDISV